ncbi:hypothetical protein V8E51_019672 [Hyaloscypha variabilis]|uniref:Extracellular membrane protein CFEM domain-containing protein n=1 Tax=Hyaloscypha variabilis (strain UAMH 11265 / GT02V1 / F) TaxID=1149755 RepID=A0A2J6QWW2_HYAVF|nr:hypothetical protein L207DRAFT_199015 [Hyaloscypha variabilis F]
MALLWFARLFLFIMLVTKVLADHDPTSTSCFTVTRTSLPDDCPHCAQPQIRELKTHTIPCGCPPALPTTVVSVPCPTKCSPTGLISWTSTSASCETTESELPKQSQPGTLTVDVSQVTIASKVKCVTITKTDGPSCTVTPTPPCPTQSLCTSVSTIKVTNYCGCDGIKETTICRTNCDISACPTTYSSLYLPCPISFPNPTTTAGGAY